MVVGVVAVHFVIVGFPCSRKFIVVVVLLLWCCGCNVEDLEQQQLQSGVPRKSCKEELRSGLQFVRPTPLKCCACQSK